MSDLITLGIGGDTDDITPLILFGLSYVYREDMDWSGLVTPLVVIPVGSPDRVVNVRVSDGTVSVNVS